MATTFKPLYSAGSTAYSISPENVASNSTFIAGVQSASVSNISNLDEDLLISGLWTSGTTPTGNTMALCWAVTPLSDNLTGTLIWPDAFGATSAARSVTSAGILATLGQVVGSMQVDSTTTARGYWSTPTSLAERFGWVPPPTHVIYVAHNSGVNSNTTTANHAWYYLRVQRQGV